MFDLVQYAKWHTVDILTETSTYTAVPICRAGFGVNLWNAWGEYSGEVL